MLLDHILHERLERRPVGLYTIRPGIAAEHVVDLLDVGLQPWQHRDQRSGIAQARERATLRFNECLIETGGQPAMLLIELAADGHEMHDRKDLVRLVELALERAIV